jgi:hypothetical protein
MRSFNIFLLSLSLNVALLFFYVKVIKPEIDEASKSVAKLICPDCKFKDLK